MRILTTIAAILLFVGVSNAQLVERYLKAIETVETGVNFIYQGYNIPVLDATYHEFSADSITWRKNFVEGDCFVRFSNTMDNTVSNPHGTGDYHQDWWVFNFCTCNGAIQPGGVGAIDTLFVYYYENDTIFSIDTILTDEGTLSFNIPAPDTITGSTTNYQDSLIHTHALYININDNQDVEATPTNGQVLKWNETLGLWVAANDLIGGGGGGSLTVQEQDGSPLVTNVNTIKIENGHVTDEGIGVVSIDFLIEVLPEKQDFFRTGTERVGAGDNFIDFRSPFPLNDYILTEAYALYDDETRQNLVYDSLAVDGFRVLSILEDSATVHYLAMRALDSLGIAAENQGRVQASSSDLVLGYLDSKTDDSTITVIDNKLTVLPISVSDITGLSDSTANVSFGQVYIDSLNLGSLTFTDTYWDDMTIPIASSAKGANAPDLEPFRGSGIYQRAFAGSVTNETMYVEGQFSHKIKTSSDISPHLHLSPSTTPSATDTVVVEFEYIWSSYNATFPTSTTITTKIPLNGRAQWEHIIYGMSADISAIDNQESSIIVGRITRLQNNASDTYANDVFIFTLDIHYEIDKIGSRNIVPD